MIDKQNTERKTEKEMNSGRCKMKVDDTLL